MDKITPDYERERDLENELEDPAIQAANIDAEFERLKPLYMNWIEDYCNVTFEGKLPGSVELALDELVKTDPKRYNIASEKLSDMSISYATGGAGNPAGTIPSYILMWLEPYRRAHLLDKQKRPYDDGR